MKIDPQDFPGLIFILYFVKKSARMRNRNRDYEGIQIEKMQSCQACKQDSTSEQAYTTADSLSACIPIKAKSKEVKAHLFKDSGRKIKLILLMKKALMSCRAVENWVLARHTLSVKPYRLARSSEMTKVCLPAGSPVLT